MLRLLFLFLLVYIFVSALRAYFSTRRRGPAPDGNRRKDGEAEEMVLDPQCGSYIPRSEALLKDGKYFCSQECAKLFLSR